MKYENILIGDFIYTLGYASGQKNIPSGKIDLLQQTPGDNPISDLLGEIGSRSFIMEFKRNRKLLSTETKKEAKDFLLKSVLEKDLLEISSKSHFIAFMEESELLVNSYLFLNPRYNSNFNNFFSQNLFFEMLIKEKIGANKDEIKTYTEYLVKHSSTSSSAILVNYLTGRKPIIIDISEGFSLNKKLEIEIVNEPKLNNQRSRGMGMGM